MNLEEITKLTGGPIIAANKNNSKNSNFILFTFITIAGIYIWTTYKPNCSFKNYPKLD